MKVFLVLNHYLPNQIAGTEIYVSLLARYLQEEGINITILIPSYETKDNITYYHNNIKVICYAEPTIVDRALIMGFKKPLGLKNFKEILLAEKPNVVHFHELAGSKGIGLAHVKLTKSLGFIVINTFHLSRYTCHTGYLLYKNKELCDGIINISKCTKCSLSNKKLNKNTKRLVTSFSSILFSLNLDFSKFRNVVGTALGYPFIIERLRNNLIDISKNSDSIVAKTLWYKKILEDNGVPTEKIAYIPQAIPQLDSTLIREPYSIAFPIRLVFIGRITFIKGLHILIEAFNKLPKDKISLDIYGKELNDDYFLKCKELSKGSYNIQWKGSVEPSEVINIMSSYHALCIPSFTAEMGPLVLKEAFAAGIPVIASNVYGNSEQVTNNKDGLLYKFDDTNSLIEILSTLISKPVILEKLANNISPQSSFRIVGDSYMKLYKNLISF